MATITREFDAQVAERGSSAFPQPLIRQGTNFPAFGYAFAPDADEYFYLRFIATGYGSGNVTVSIDWYSDTATSGVVRWSAQIAAMTPDTDSQSVETKAFGTAATVDDTHLGTTGKRPHRAVISVSSLDSLAAGDEVYLKVGRVATHANDTMNTSDAIVNFVTVSYSDT